LGVGGFNKKPKNGRSRSTNSSELQKVSAGSLHAPPWNRDKQTAREATFIMRIRNEVKYVTTKPRSRIQETSPHTTPCLHPKPDDKFAKVKQAASGFY
jgi:hypothetical protein